jgi:hypothetical protein
LLLCYNSYGAYEVEGTDEFANWYGDLADDEQERVNFAVGLLEEMGPALGRPHADTVRGSEYANMKELRVQIAGRPIRIFYAFDARRTGILLIGGDKTGDKLFYDRMVPQADALYAQHLYEIED